MRPKLVWAIFFACLSVFVLGFAWLSSDLQSKARELRYQEVLEQNSRLALWRMDSAMTSLITQEVVRPVEDYRADGQDLRTNSLTYQSGGSEEANSFSPLVRFSSPYVFLHFQIEPNGAVTSPQIVSDDRAKSLDAATRSLLKPRAELLAQLRTKLDANVLMNEHAIADASCVAVGVESVEPAQDYKAQRVQVRNRVALHEQTLNQAWSSNRETWRTRNLVEGRTRNFLCTPGNVSQFLGCAPIDIATRSQVIRPVWSDGELFLVRSVVLDGRSVVQGAWLNWPAANAWLIENVADLVANSELVPSGEAGPGVGDRRLASIPVELKVGELPEGTVIPETPVTASLTIAWSSVAVSGFAVAALLLAALTLSERRRDFVAAVTHELRTPLTTFRMYAEMLAGGMVEDPEKKQAYLGKLQSEADRLSHLVENVLAYAKLESGRAGGGRTKVSVQGLVDSFSDRLIDRVEQTPMQLEIDIAEDLVSSDVRVDVSAFEQVIANLVDNSCKYAVDAEDRRIHLSVVRAGTNAQFTVRDHGEGVPDDVRSRLFRPFSKSVSEAAQSCPGVGLGLALSRRYARDLGGELSYEPAADGGSQFHLTVPLRS